LPAGVEASQSTSPERGYARLAERREQQLILAYCQFLREKGSHVTRHLIRPEGEAKPLFSDLYDTTRNNLLEAKGTVKREAIRMAIGQLADYRRFIEARPSCAVLLPERPRPDLEARGSLDAGLTLAGRLVAPARFEGASRDEVVKGGFLASRHPHPSSSASRRRCTPKPLDKHVGTVETRR
jgi:hypothetical protein